MFISFLVYSYQLKSEMSILCLRLLPPSNFPWFSLHIVTTAILTPSPRLRPCITVAPGIRDLTPDVLITQHLTSLGTNFTQTLQGLSQ